jgi:transcription initiation factor TFIIB
MFQKQETAIEPHRPCTCMGSSTVYDPDRFETICTGCGAVVEEAEHSSDPGVVRGMPTRLLRDRMGAHLRTMTTSDGVKCELRAKTKGASAGDTRRMVRANSLVYQQSIDRGLGRASAIVSSMSVRLGVPDTVGFNALAVYKQAKDAGLVKGRSMETMCAACLYIVCRQMRIPRTIASVVELVGGEPHKHGVNAAYRLVVTSLGLEVPSADICSLVTKPAQALRLKESTVRRIYEVIELTRAKGLHNGRDPMSIIGGILYVVAEECGERRTMDQVSDACGRVHASIKHRATEVRTLIQA